MMKPMEKTLPHEQVSVLAATLEPGATLRTACPKCFGGQSGEKSFSVTRTEEGRVIYKCFRAKCSWGGKILSGSSVTDRTALPFYARRSCFDRPIEALDDNQVRWYREKFGVSPDKDISYCPSRDMYAYRIKGPNGQLRGWQLRSYVEGATLRAQNYVHMDEPFISWHFAKRPLLGGVVVVEDIPSARKASSCGVSSVALLGTAIDFERAYEIASLCENFVIVALDRGMLGQAIKYRQMYEPVWGSVEIWQLNEDLKYVDTKRIKEALLDGKSDFISVPN